jgi:hypothetical protein
VGLWLLGEEGMDHDTLAGQSYFPTLTASVAAGSYEVQLNLIAGLVLQLPRR